jgi:hypothetical protein
MKTFGRTLFAVAVLMLAPAAFGQAKTAAPAAASRAIYGKAVGHKYYNAVLGIRVALPDALVIAEPNYVDLTLAAAPAVGGIFAGKNLTVKNILTAEVFPVSFIWTAMKLPAGRENVTGEQVLRDPLFKGAGTSVVKVEKLGNNTLAYVDQSFRFAESRSYAFVRKGYYVSVVIRYKSPDDLNVLRDVLADADLDWDGRGNPF